ncbi:MAG: TlpA family protein disulfide reductase [Alphaproteobacteria bacterium]|nr:TlpA family protein disulfide reductase [Alphaproteobacteria bacterium]
MTTFVFKKQPTAVVKQPTFNGPDGQSMTLDDLKGKVVLLNLWATWCAPCRKEMPYLDTLQKELGSDQFEVVALSVDRGSPQKAKDFLAEVGASSLKFYHDPTAQAGFALMAIGMPTTLLFDREGREIGRLAGPAEWHSKEAKDLIRAAIAAG